MTQDKTPENPLVTGIQMGYENMLRDMMESLCDDGGVPVGLVLFGMVDGNVEVYLGGDTWPGDVDTVWPTLVESLAETVAQAQKIKAEQDASQNSSTKAPEADGGSN